MGIKMNTNPQKCQAFADEVGAFPETIYKDCKALAEATKTLASKTDRTTVKKTQDMLVEIMEVVQEATPRFKEISSEAGAYAKKLFEIRRLSGS